MGHPAETLGAITDTDRHAGAEYRDDGLVAAQIILPRQELGGKAMIPGIEITGDVLKTIYDCWLRQHGCSLAFRLT
ncbi:hypothetical protein [Candidatus Thiodictyon syntrophicum]|nr:hypothetical protein [Candidatus Thiodictyon syntrophicum]